MVTYNSTDNALELSDEDKLKVGDYELGYDSTLDEWQAKYGKPIGGENGNHATIRGNVVYSPVSKVGSHSLKFDTTGGYVDVGRLGQEYDTFTVSAWIKPEDSSFSGGIISADSTDEPQRHFQLKLSIDRTIQFITFDSTNSVVSEKSEMQLDLGQWYFVTAVADDTSNKIYINGSLDGEITTDRVQRDVGVEIGTISEANSNEDFKGNIDDVKGYTRSLSTSEITDLYNGVDVTENLVYHYDFEYPETPRVAIDSTGDVYPRNSVPRSTSGSLVPQGLAESVSSGKALADNGEMYDSVQTAVDNATGWVFVGPGTFNESVTISTDGMTLEGCGNNTKITHETDIPLLLSASNVRVHSINVESSDNNAIHMEEQNENITIKNISVKSVGGVGIRCDSTDSKITECAVSESDDNSNVRIEGSNTVIKSSTFSGTTGSFTRNIDISANNCIIASCICENAAQDGIQINSGNDSIVISNRISNAGRDGIQINSGMNDNIIANNRVSDSANDDILDNGTGTVLDDNLTGASN